MYRVKYNLWWNWSAKIILYKYNINRNNRISFILLRILLFEILSFQKKKKFEI